jgi:hypothetical protein
LRSCHTHCAACHLIYSPGSGSRTLDIQPWNSLSLGLWIHGGFQGLDTGPRQPQAQACLGLLRPQQPWHRPLHPTLPFHSASRRLPKCHATYNECTTLPTLVPCHMLLEVILGRFRAPGPPFWGTILGLKGLPGSLPGAPGSPGFKALGGLSGPKGAHLDPPKAGPGEPRTASSHLQPVSAYALVSVCSSDTGPLHYYGLGKQPVVDQPGLKGPWATLA